VSFEWLAEDYRTWEDEEDGWGLSAGVDPWPKPFGSSAALRRRVIESGDCWVCAGIADEADHLVPAREGGEYVEANLAPICSSCNKARYHDERRFGTWEKAYDLARIQGYDGPPPTRRG
jgi:5-methylcytosine-specific restriction endonuclease McrA